MWRANFNREIVDTVTVFIWKQWALLGVAGEPSSGTRRIVDLEALLILIWSFGRHDPRLFDAVFHWSSENESFIDFRRLKSSIVKCDKATQSISAAWATALVDRGQRRWAPICTNKSSNSVPRPLFVESGPDSNEVFGSVDATYESHGWLRGRIDTSSPFRLVDLHHPALIRLLFRRLIGIGAKAEILTYAFRNDSATTQFLSDFSGYSQRSIQLALSDLQSINLVNWTRVRGVSDPVVFNVPAISKMVSALCLSPNTTLISSAQKTPENTLLLACTMTKIYKMSNLLFEVEGEAGQLQLLWEIADHLNIRDDAAIGAHVFEKSASRYQSIGRSTSQILKWLATVFA